MKDRIIKCVVWDLDGTLWDGILSEDKRVSARPSAVEIVRALDARGILQSVASKNDREPALKELLDIGIHDHFLYPEIHWGSKAESVGRIAKKLNIGLDAVAFVDDQPFERDAVAFAHPSVLCLDAAALDGVLAMPELMPRFITDDSKNRRAMYLADIARNEAEERFDGPKEDFLATLGMRLSLAPAGEDDLMRAEELTIRTNQLNSTGRTYSYDELDALRASPSHALWIAGLEDRYGSYGKIGLILIERGGPAWTLRLFLMSCRVMSRGIGAILLNHVIARAKQAGARLLAEFIPNDRNRMMFVTYKFAGFREASRERGTIFLEAPQGSVPPCPPYVELRAEGDAALTY
jgi:FkbH-like protein